MRVVPRAMAVMPMHDRCAQYVSRVCGGVVAVGGGRRSWRFCSVWWCALAGVAD